MKKKKKNGSTTLKHTPVERVSKTGKLSPATIGLIVGTAAAGVLTLITPTALYGDQ